MNAGGSARSTGTVQRFDQALGFGAIADDADGVELFVHRGSLRISGAAIEAGDRVEFEVREGGMGAQAIDVRAISPADATD
jgi:cold shock protein